MHLNEKDLRDIQATGVRGGVRPHRIVRHVPQSPPSLTGDLLVILTFSAIWHVIQSKITIVRLWWLTQAPQKRHPAPQQPHMEKKSWLHHCCGLVCSA